MRTSHSELHERATTDLAAALREIGLTNSIRDESVVAMIDGRSREIVVHAAAVASPAQVGVLVGSKPRRGLHALVADRISADARRMLDDAGWIWLDRRGEISFQVNARFFIRRPTTPSVRAPRPSQGPVRSRAGIAYLATALEHPDDTPVLRAVARRAGLSHVALSNAKTRLRDADLIDERGRAIEHITFEALSESWTPTVVALATTPSAANALALAVQPADPEQAGWALTDTLGAIAWGANLPVAVDYPPDFIVPTPSAFDRAIHVLGTATSFDVRAATICVAPIPFATDHRYRLPGTEHLVTHPLYVALAIARDHARGPEILAAWNPKGPEGFQRTW